MATNRAGEIKAYKESVAEGIARGVLKSDGPIVSNDHGITGHEVMGKGDFRREIGELALSIHDRLIEQGELEPNESLRAHILRIISEAV